MFGERFYILGGYQRTDNPMVMRVLNSVGCCCPSSDEWQLLPPMLQPRMSPRGVVAIGNGVDGVDDNSDGEDGGVDAVTVTIIALCTDYSRQLALLYSSSLGLPSAVTAYHHSSWYQLAELHRQTRRFKC